MSVQFKRFILEAFINYPPLNFVDRVLIIIDGLDECDQSHTQRNLLQLISDFCLTYPSSPIVWMIASRPEPHITSFFAQANVEPAYEKEELLVDSNEAREDVERLLRTELRRIQTEFSLNLRMQWPEERDIWKLANASSGLFIYAQTVVKYIGDLDIGDPELQLNDVLKVINSHPLPNVRFEDHPMAPLDALYSRILSRVSTKVKENTRKLLLALAMGWEPKFDREGRTFIVLCNWLGMTSSEAYSALRPLSAVLAIPGRDTAHGEDLRCFHKSFLDYICDFSRSGFSHDIQREARELYVQCTLRVLGQAPNGIDVDGLYYDVSNEHTIGTLARVSGKSGTISLTWPADGRSAWDDSRPRLFIYQMAVASVVKGIEQRDQAFYTVSHIHLLAMCFRSLTVPGIRNLHEVVFVSSSGIHMFVSLNWNVRMNLDVMISWHGACCGKYLSKCLIFSICNGTSGCSSVVPAPPG
jgi:hypothetical protein